MYFHQAVDGMVLSGKYASRAGTATGTFQYYDKANKRISTWSGGAGTRNAPTMASGSGAAYTLAMADIIDASTGLPVMDWSYVG